MADILARFQADPPRHLSPVDPTGGMGTCGFRRVFELSKSPIGAMLALYAECRFHLWINGRYVGRGPTFHHPHRLPVTVFDVTAHLRPGRNVAAALVRWTDQPFHNHVPTGRPGLSARLCATLPGGEEQTIDTDGRWRCTTATGWRSAAPRRSWAIDHIEIFDAADAPDGWREVDFDDGGWTAPNVIDTALPDANSRYIAAELPALRRRFVPVVRRIGLYQTASQPVRIDATFGTRTYAEQLLAADRASPTGIAMHGDINADGGGWRIDGLRDDCGAVVELDLGAEYVGRIMLECDCPSAGVIDVGWSEYIRDGRPTPLQKGASYADQLHVARAGPLSWQPIQFTGGRYVVLYFRGFAGSVTIKRLGMEATEPDLDWRGDFHCDDAVLNDIFALCKRTIRIGTQEALMDCPTREQATYIGDGHPVARWIALLTGDLRHWRHMTREQAARPDKSGLIRSSPFSGGYHTLLDYNLLAVIWARDYLRFTHDADAVTPTLPALRNIVAYFDQRTDSRGLFDWHWTDAPGNNSWEKVYDPTAPHIDTLNLFIDHPGMGWHNLGEPGINRRGFNTAVNALRVRTMRALADMEESLGDAKRAMSLRDAAGRLARTIAAIFYRPDRGLFDDGELDGRPLNNFSQQTNAWALLALADELPAAQQALIAKTMIDPSDKTIAQAGPYFWIYLYPVLMRWGLAGQALDITKRSWARMLSGGATALWETFVGDDLDTACHPWSAPPLDFLLTGLLGLPGEPGDDGRYVLRPRCDLLKHATGRVCLPAGDFVTGWKKDARGGVHFTGETPADAKVRIELSDGRASGAMRGRWNWSAGPT